VPGLERAGALSILALPPERPPEGPSDPAEQAAFWEDWTRRATGQGFRGLRAAGDATEWVRTADEQAVHLAYEAQLDRVTGRAPLSVMCAFDRSRLGADVAAAFAEIHPLVSRAAAPFQLVFSDEHDLTLRGEVDLADVRALRRSLELVAPGPVTGGAGGELHVDARELLFIDHHGLLELERFGADHRATLVLHDAGTTCAQEVVDLLDLRCVRVVEEPPGRLGTTTAPGGEGQDPRER
jgi:hypothetical protein